ncbi:MAG: hypothetical protein PHC75_06930 [Burkholderiales bacterium]|nr:hypothetical protein [Burkholderiales bacterium]
MQNKLKLTLALIIGSALTILTANAVESSATVNASAVKPTTKSNSLVSSPILQRADNDYNQLNELKRQAAIKEQQAKLVPQISQSGASTGASNSSYLLSAPKVADILVTNVIVNKNNSFANLKFPNGETLLVYIGDKVDGYTVRNISMSGVSVAKCGKKCGKSVLLKRTYNSSFDVPSAGLVSSNISTTDSSNTGDQSLNQVPPIMRAP